MPIIEMIFVMEQTTQGKQQQFVKNTFMVVLAELVKFDDILKWLITILT
ncbi:MAG: hypothetical protein MJ223_02855 [Mycoplasmoidaceae bacterium]|nr:hypothetical protein [Mycoplasmoidaceae bacterium]